MHFNPLAKNVDSRRRDGRGGFSLVVSLVMMALMLTVAITLVSFVYVQGKLTESRLKRAQAQLNAVSGLRMALGQLQLLSGDDQRVTATGDIFGGNGNDSLPSGEAVNGKRYWTGVWATGGLDKSKVRDWSVYSPDRKPFLGWLVSDYDASKEVYSPAENPVNAETASRGNDSLLKKVQEAFDSEDAESDLVTLVGRGSLGTDRDAAGERNLKEREVVVRRVPLVRNSASSTESILSQTGSFAYWVGDEGVKARVNIPDGTDERFVRQGDWERRFNVVAQRNGVSLAEGLSRFDSWWEKDAENAGAAGRTLLSHVTDAQTLPLYASLMGGGSGDDVRETAQKLYHDVSYVSQGVFSDVYNGGLKTDLSVAFEMPWFSEGSWKKGFRDIEQFHGSGEKNELNLLGKFKVPSDERWWTEQPEDGFGYLYEFSTNETTMRNGRGGHEYLRGPTWDLVRNYYRLYKREDEKKGFRGLKAGDDDSWIAVGSRPYSYAAGNSNNKARSNYSAMVNICYDPQYLSVDQPLLLTEFDGTERAKTYGPGIIPQSMRIAPVVQRFVIRYSLAVDTSDKYVRICYDPVLFVHNPYNVPLEFSGFGVFWKKTVPFSLRLSRKDVEEQEDGTTQVKSWPGPAKSSNLSISRPTTMNMNYNYRFYATSNYGGSVSGTKVLAPGEIAVFWPESGGGDAGEGNVQILGAQVSGGGGAADKLLRYEKYASTYLPYTYFDIQADPNYDPETQGIGPVDENITFTAQAIYPQGVSSSDKNNWFWAETDLYSFYLFYPEDAEGNSAKTSDRWDFNTNFADSSSETLVQTLQVRKWSKNDDREELPVSQAFTLAAIGGEKTTFWEMDIFRRLADTENPLAGPLKTNLRAQVISPLFYDADMTNRFSGNGWVSRLDTFISDVDPNIIPVQDLSSPRWGDGDEHDPSSGELSNIVLFEIPKAPLLSLGQLQHVECSVLETDPGYVVGNSYPHMGIENLTEIFEWPGIGDFSGKINAALSPQPRGDLSFAANLNLFDRYFFSGVNFGDADSAQREDMDAFVEDAFSDDASKNPFPNRRVTLIRDFGDRKEADVKEDFYDPEKIARNLLLNGAFNVNSTSVEAWKAVLAGLHGKLLQLDGKFDEVSETPFARFMALIGARAGGFGNVADNFRDEGSGWRWYSELSDDMLQKLAEALVEQVRSRGPFMSMGDFVNRRLSGEDEGKAGALQAAIDAADVNKSARSSFGDGGNASNPDDKRYPNLFPTDVASKKAGVPGYVTQGDVLANVGPGLSARSDTFTIRAYGDISGLTGTPEARAWCEAVVQRLPEFFDPQEDEEGGEMIDVVEFRENYRDRQDDEVSGRPEKYVLEKFSRNDKLSSVNRLFGRRYKIISFRWLSQDEL